MWASPGPVWPLSARRSEPSLRSSTSAGRAGADACRGTRGCPRARHAARGCGARPGSAGEQGVGDAGARDGGVDRLAGPGGVARVGRAHLGQHARGAERPRDGLQPLRGCGRSPAPPGRRPRAAARRARTPAVVKPPVGVAQDRPRGAEERAVEVEVDDRRGPAPPALRPRSPASTSRHRRPLVGPRVELGEHEPVPAPHRARVGAGRRPARRARGPPAPSAAQHRLARSSRPSPRGPPSAGWCAAGRRGRPGPARRGRRRGRGRSAGRSPRRSR